MGFIRMFSAEGVHAVEVTKEGPRGSIKPFGFRVSLIGARDSFNDNSGCKASNPSPSSSSSILGIIVKVAAEVTLGKPCWLISLTGSLR
jgi:hypothetical protein